MHQQSVNLIRCLSIYSNLEISVRTSGMELISLSRTTTGKDLFNNSAHITSMKLFLVVEPFKKSNMIGRVFLKWRACPLTLTSLQKHHSPNSTQIQNSISTNTKQTLNTLKVYHRQSTRFTSEASPQRQVKSQTGKTR